MKTNFNIESVMAIVRQAVAPFPKAALFELRDEGYASPFEQLLACLISIRTRDETTLRCARRLFALARAPAQMAALAPAQIDQAIAASTFHESKAYQIQRIAQQVLTDYNGTLPCDDAKLLAFHGVGVKCANLVLGIACAQPRIAVDIHVHRVTNRWGYVATATPEKTLAALSRVLPQPYWVEINELLVPFGKHICTGTAPKCSGCPLLAQCEQVGVTTHR